MQVSSRRSEKRIPKAVEVTGYRSNGSSLSKGTFTENVSTRGARVVTMSMLELGATIEIHFLMRDFGCVAAWFIVSRCLVGNSLPSSSFKIEING
jgi:hypothetical protein